MITLDGALVHKSVEQPMRNTLKYNSRDAVSLKLKPLAG